MRKRVFGREFKLEAIKLAQGQALVTMGSRATRVSSRWSCAETRSVAEQPT